jgi:hypothetical protein
MTCSPLTEQLLSEGLRSGVVTIQRQKQFVVREVSKGGLVILRQLFGSLRH